MSHNEDSCCVLFAGKFFLDDSAQKLLSLSLRCEISGGSLDAFRTLAGSGSSLALLKARHNLAMDNEGLLLASLRLIAAPPI